MPRRVRTSLPIALVLLLAACGSSPPPAASTQPASPQTTELRDSIQKPLDKAKGVEGTVEQSFQSQNRQLDAAEGASPASSASPASP
ncbi:MAG: hypothetical protein JSR34_07270 [Proteobacteria bacterium]|nr:hypothetical protein [Pseudomonadota bacterium]